MNYNSQGSVHSNEGTLASSTVSVGRGAIMPHRCDNAPNMKLSLLPSEIQDVHASSHLNLLKY